MNQSAPLTSPSPAPQAPALSALEAAPAQLDNAIIEAYAGLEGRALIQAIVQNYAGRVGLVSSFGAESSVLLHMVSEVAPDLPIIFMDTLMLFPETLRYRDELISQLGLTNVTSLTPDPIDLETYDPDNNLHQWDADGCCHIRKTIPMAKATAAFDVLISGRKRFHGAARANIDFVSLLDGKLKVEPLAGFSALDLQSYMVRHELPSHPLRLQGYRSIGCMPCTSKGGTDDNPRAGRWAGSDKTECGIHFSASGKMIRKVVRG